MKMVSYFFKIAIVVLTISQQATANKQGVCTVHSQLRGVSVHNYNYSSS